jgi:hypothetical protein
MAGVGSAALALQGGRPAGAQAPPRGAPSDAEGRRRCLSAALREMNEAAGLGVASDDLEGAEAYAVGALLEAEAKLRPLRLDPSLDVSVVFRARRRS